jgi:hypothetical protein
MTAGKDGGLNNAVVNGDRRLSLAFAGGFSESYAHA